MPGFLHLHPGEAIRAGLLRLVISSRRRPPEDSS